jgi:hypothetical protein
MVPGRAGVTGTMQTISALTPHLPIHIDAQGCDWVELM